jgi:putative transposase
MPRPRKPQRPFRYFNSSPEVIRLVVMMYVRYPLSLRNVEDLLFERGIDICHETVRHWWNRFGPMFAADIRRQRVSRMRGFRQWQWHLDEMYVKLNGEMVYLWRAVDQEGEILESYVTRTRDKAAALTFMKKALKRQGSPETITTDGLRSYRAAMTELGCAQKQEVGRWANNRVENSHLPFRRRERAMLRFRRMSCLQKFASLHANVHNHQPRTPPRRSTDLQGPPLGRTGRVAEPHGLRLAGEGESCVDRRQVAIRLTAPPPVQTVCSAAARPYYRGERCRWDMGASVESRALEVSPLRFRTVELRHLRRCLLVP